MKRFLKALATFSLVELIGRYPVRAGVLMLLGVGGGAGIAMLTTPTILPQAASNFNPNQAIGSTSNGLSVNYGGAAGAVEQPVGPSTGATGSFVFYFEAMVDPAFSGYQTPFGGILGLQGTAGGSPAFSFQRLQGGQANAPWLLEPSEIVGNTLTAAAGSNYNTGLYQLTATGGGCTRPPSGVWLGSGTTFQITDPGLGCPTPPTINMASVPASGAQQATGYGSAATTCVSNSPVSGEMTVTAHLQYAHGITPGMTYSLQGFTAQTGYNATYTAINGTTSTTLVGETVTGGGTCPTSPATVEGTALSGTSAALIFPAPSPTTPFGLNAAGTTGITTKLGQRICGIIGEYGDDASSPFPGAQIISMVDDKGNPLPGAPVVIPTPNQGTANFTGYTVVNTQSPTFFNATFASGTMTATTSQTLTTGQLIAGPGIPAGTTVTAGATGTSFSISNSSITITTAETVTANYPALFVTAMNPYTISAGSYSGTTGYVTFTTSTAPGFVAGSEFTVSGLTNTGSTINQTYVVVNPSGLSLSALQSATTIVGNPLSGPGGTPQAFTTAPSGISAPGGSQMVSVVTPGMTILGVTGGSTNASIIAPYGTNGTTGVGGVGNYALTSNQTSGTTFTVSAASSLQITVTGTPTVPIVVGTNFTLNSNSYVIASLGTGTGAAGTYNVASGSPAAGTATMTGALGSSGTPVNLFAYTPYYYYGPAGSPPAAASSSPSGGSVTAKSPSYLADFIGTFGAVNSAVSGSLKTGWGGSLSNVAMLYGVFPQVAGVPSTTALANLCKKTPGNDLHSFAAANSMTINSLYELNDLGLWGESKYADFTGSISGTTLTVASTQYGTLPTVTSGSPSVTISGAGITGCPSTCPTISSGSAGSYVLSASGGTVASEPMKAGLYKPAKPVASQNFQGYTSGNTLTVTSLDPSGNAGFSSFTGTLGTSFTGSISGNTLTLTLPVVTLTSSPQSPAVIGIGTVVCPAVATPGAFTCATVTALGTGAGGSGTYTINGSAQTVASQVMYGSGILPGPPTALQTSGTVVGTPSVGMFVADATAGTFLTGSPLLVQGITGTTPNFVLTLNGSYYPASTSPTSMIASLSTLIPGEYIQNGSITTPVKVLGYAGAGGVTGAFNGGLGAYTLSTSANGTIGSSGSPATFTGTTITDGGAVAPGPALTIRDQGPGVMFPVSHSTNTGTLWLSGTYDTALLGGTPSAIQAQVSQTANGAPVSGCAACAWANLSSYVVTPYTFSASITTGGAMTVPLSSDQPAVGNAFTGAGYSGTITASPSLGSFTVSPSPGSAVALETMTATTVYKWSGQAASIPGGGPYYVSVRAANGAGYATLPNSIKVGDVLGAWGQGQFDGALSTQGGINVSWFQNLWGTANWQSPYAGDKSYLLGPPVAGYFVPSLSLNYAGDRYGATGGAPLVEATAAFDQTLTNAFGFPASLIKSTHNGVGAIMNTLGGAMQAQTIGAGDGSTLDWCSATKFCASAGVSPAGPLYFNAASLTGGTIAGATVAAGTGSLTGLSVLTVPATTSSAGLWQGALEPGMTISDGAVNIPAGTTLVRCVTGCTSATYLPGGTFPAQTWVTSNNSLVVSTPETMRADPTSALAPFGASSAPWPNFMIQQVDGVPFALTGYGVDIVKAGTFSATVNGTVVCTDTQAFAYNNTGGNCTPVSGNPAYVDVTNSFVNYQTGDYQIAFLSGHAPASGAVISATWTNILSPENIASAQYSRVQGLDFFGDGTSQGGADSSIYNKTPGGVSGHIFAGLGGTDKGYLGVGDNFANDPQGGYQFGGPGYSQMVSWLYGTKFPNTIPGASASVAFISTGQWRVEGPTYVFTETGVYDGVYDQWAQDVVTPSSFNGHVSIAGSATTGTLTLDGPATGPMWEGEVLGCQASVTPPCPVPAGVYITSLASGTWGAIGSVYNVAAAASTAGVSTSAGVQLQNAVLYSGAGPAVYGGSLYDIIDQTTGLVSNGVNPHPNNGFAGGRRVTSRIAATWWGATNGSVTASVPTVDRVKADAGGCDTAAIATPCFDIGNTYAASHSATMVSSSATITVTGGLSSNQRPFVVGQVLSCASCTAGRVILAVDAPPTQSAVSGAGQVGNTFHITASGTMGVSSTETLTAGCSGTSGAGSNCIDIAISVNDNGTFGTAAAIATCGANNLNGNSPGFIVPYGKCQDNGSGEIVRTIRIGTTALMSGNTTYAQPGSVFDDGADMSGATFNQSAAFTCNIVKASAPGVVQCVKGPVYSSGIFSSVGEWTIGSTFINYGNVGITGRGNSIMGYVGGQSFPITAGGSGYSNQTVTAVCSPLASGATEPKFDIWTSSGVIVSVTPSTSSNSEGLGIGGTCAITPTGGSGATIPAIVYGPVEGVGGVATYNTDSNQMGTFIYDNSGFPGNPMNGFFTNGMGGYFEPGLPVKSFGQFQGVAVSG